MSVNTNPITPTFENSFRMATNAHISRNDRSPYCSQQESSDHDDNNASKQANLNIGIYGHSSNNSSPSLSQYHHLQSNKLENGDDEPISAAAVTPTAQNGSNIVKKNSKKLPKLTGLFSNNSHSKDDLETLNEQDRDQFNIVVDGNDIKRTQSAGQSSLEEKVKSSKFKRSKNRSGSSKNHEETLQWQSLLTKYIANKKTIQMLELCKAENVGLRDAAIKILKNDYGITDVVMPKEASHKRSFKKRISKKKRNNSSNDKDSKTSTKIFTIPLSKVIANDEKSRQDEINQLKLAQKSANTKGDVDAEDINQIFASASLGSPKAFRRSLIAALEVNKDCKMPRLNQGRRKQNILTSPIMERRNSILVEALTLPSSDENKRRQNNNHRDPDEYVVQQPKIPLIVTKSIEFIEKNGLRAEGLFRIASSKKKIKQICADLDNGQPIQFDENEHTPHDVISIFKDFFRYLPEPLLTRELYSSFLATKKLSPEERKEALKLLCCILPIPNRDTLRSLVAFLNNVAKNADDIVTNDGEKIPGNKMDISNLAKVMGPNILHKMKNVNQDFAVDSADRVDDTPIVIGITEDLIELNSTLFEISSNLYRKSFLALLEREPAAAVQLLNKKQEQLLREKESNETLNLGQKLKRDDSNTKETVDRSELTASNLSLPSSTNAGLKQTEIIPISQATVNGSNTESNQSENQFQSAKHHNNDSIRENRRLKTTLNQQQVQVGNDPATLNLNSYTSSSSNSEIDYPNSSSSVATTNPLLRRYSDRVSDTNLSTILAARSNEYHEPASPSCPRENSVGDISIMPTFRHQDGLHQQTNRVSNQEQSNINSNGGSSIADVNITSTFHNQDSVRQQTIRTPTQDYGNSSSIVNNVDLSIMPTFQHHHDGLRQQTIRTPHQDSNHQQTIRTPNQDHIKNSNDIKSNILSQDGMRQQAMRGTNLELINANSNTNINSSANNNNNNSTINNSNITTSSNNNSNTNNAVIASSNNIFNNGNNLNIIPTFHQQDGLRQHKTKVPNQDPVNTDTSNGNHSNRNSRITRSQSTKHRSSRDHSYQEYPLNNSLNKPNNMPQRRSSFQYRNQTYDNYNNIAHVEHWNRNETVDIQFATSSSMGHHEDRQPTSSPNIYQPPLAAPEKDEFSRHHTQNYPNGQPQGIPNRSIDQFNVAFKASPYPINNRYNSSSNHPFEGEYGRARSSSNCESKNRYKQAANTSPVASSYTASSQFLAKSVENMYTVQNSSITGSGVEQTPGLPAEIHLLITPTHGDTERGAERDAEKDQELFEKMQHQFNMGTTRKDVQHISLV
ncbi:Rho GTPase-activating protein 6 [Trichoplax sp. H2]|nr:Rho GTPase-activating protein 6 [Trichoplax sp. H2]|eukprot:RDD46797.1 Rho GTPase-activating protein 6 [Trichoplax sp. H2]